MFQHRSIASLRRELLRNGQLQALCGFTGTVPPAPVYSRFLRQLRTQTGKLQVVFERLTSELGEKLPDFGQCLALDGKAISNHARPTRKEGAAQAADGRRETDADWGVKVYQGQHAHGTAWEKQVSWFGVRLHRLVDAQYELPVAFKVTRAASEVRCARQLLDAWQERQPWLLERGEQFWADRDYADSKF